VRHNLRHQIIAKPVTAQQLKKPDIYGPHPFKFLPAGNASMEVILEKQFFTASEFIVQVSLKQAFYLDT
jgi:hypothetical protein